MDKLGYFSFMHGVKKKEFGPYPSRSEARDAFQRVYGYWPGECVAERPYEPPKGK